MNKIEVTKMIKGKIAREETLVTFFGTSAGSL
ncbi:uncharacterized protein METZ01_LOCUS195899 [marine metagenome]|uniref:Uncharacterized protein n=1 Tax=marine metagenome TaxID=408172 RepID=A0A382DXR4_9ZZZZ